MESKEVFLSQLKPAITEQLKVEVAKGDLDVSKTYDFEANFSRIYDALKKNKMLTIAFRAFKVSKEDLKCLVRECLTEVGVQL